MHSFTFVYQNYITFAQYCQYFFTKKLSFFLKIYNKNPSAPAIRKPQGRLDKISEHTDLIRFVEIVKHAVLAQLFDHAFVELCTDLEILHREERLFVSCLDDMLGRVFAKSTQGRERHTNGTLSLRAKATSIRHVDIDRQKLDAARQRFHGKLEGRNGILLLGRCLFAAFFDILDILLLL